MKRTKQILSAVLALGLTMSVVSPAAMADDTAVAPQKAAYGYFVDSYKGNSSGNKTPDTNPTIGVLSGFSSLWKTGSTWDTGSALDSATLNQNIQDCVTITGNRTADQEKQAYLDDRRNQSYSVTDGLGGYTDLFRSMSGATTTISDTIPADATTKSYSDGGDSKGNWAEEDSSLGSMVKLVDTLRGNYSSTTPAKNYFLYPRPWRQSTSVKVVPTLVPVESTTPATDSGFPSGHTNAAYLTAFALGYAAPQRYSQLLTRASELGNNRIIAGMHSPLDVMGGRVMSTALAAAILNDADNQSIKTDAYTQAQTKLLTQNGTSADRFADYAANKKDYIARLTYGFAQTGDKTKVMVVPKGAEVLLETRLPYLDATQRRWVLFSTGLPSGYPVLDDAEGWGRLDLFSASNGYGSFDTNVDVTMDAAKGGFNALDSWRNDISGTGSLTKEGTGTLMLTGKNSYTGGTAISGGVLEADSGTAFGTGTVTNAGGTLEERVAGSLTLGGLSQKSGTLALTLKEKNDILKVKGNASLGGALSIQLLNGYLPANNMTIISCNSMTRGAKFSTLKISGLKSGYAAKLIYTSNAVKLQVTKTK